MITEAGLDGIGWLKTSDRVESLVTSAVARRVLERRAEAHKKAEGK
jgi:hypothetical protein